MYKGEYLTGDFQTFTVYENGKVVAKRKTRKPVNFVIKYWNGLAKNGKGVWKYAFTFQRKPDLNIFNRYADDDVRHGHKRRYGAIFNENNEATIEERAKAEDIEINLERVRKQYTNSKHLQVDVNRLKNLGII